MEDIPLNHGCLEPIDIVVPQPSMLAPVYPSAVVAGSVETSQAVTDTIFDALGVMAAAAAQRAATGWGVLMANG